MIRRCLFCGLLLGICSTAFGQTVKDVSKPIRLNFGFPELQVSNDFKFEDENDNGIVEPGEGSLISFTLQNVGPYPAKNVTVFPRELNDIQGLSLADSIVVGDLASGASKLVQVGIYTEDVLQRGNASLVFEIRENGTYVDISVGYSVDTSDEVSRE